MGRPWGRLYSGTRNHRKVVKLSRRHPRHWWVFYPLLEMSFETWDGGEIFAAPEIPYTLAELSEEVRLSPKKLLPVLETMAELSLVNLRTEYRNCDHPNAKNMAIFLRFLGWNERQFISDLSTNRTQKHRAKAKESISYSTSGTPMERPGNGDGNEPDIESDTEPDTDTKNNAFPFSVPRKGDGDGDRLKPREKGTSPRAKGTIPSAVKTLLPPNFGISNAVRKWAEAKGYDCLEEHLEYFKDWAVASGRKYLDWNATFRNAIRGNWAKLGLTTGPPASAPPGPREYDPNCPKCKGKGLYENPPGADSYTPCKCWKRNVFLS